jgi:hypothetical protein
MLEQLVALPEALGTAHTLLADNPKKSSYPLPWMSQAIEISA